jgi:hypothetical protein
MKFWVIFLAMSVGGPAVSFIGTTAIVNAVYRRKERQ